MGRQCDFYCGMDVGARQADLIILETADLLELKFKYKKAFSER